MKKILLILFLCIFTFGFSQQNLQVKTNNTSSIKGLSTFPNPFTESTRITFKSNKNQEVKLIVKNLLGKTVFLHKFSIKPGNISLSFHKNELKSGTYIYSIQTDSEIISKRLVIK